MAPPLELRRGARVRWRPAHSDDRLEGKLMRPSPTNEEWLVRSDTGQQLWISVTQLEPAPES
jgi:hypothetical protein